MKKLYLRNRMCFTINGFNRAIIYDLNRQDYYFAPVPLYEIIVNDDVIIFDDAETKVWKQFLLDKELIFTIDSPSEIELFPIASTKFETPNLFSCLILHDNIAQKLFQNFESLHLLNVSVVVHKYDKLKTKKFLESLAKYEIDSIYLFLPEKNRNYSIHEFENLNSIRQLFNIYLFDGSTQIESETEEKKVYDSVNVVSLPYSFENFSSAMLVEKMQVNYNHFFEAYNFHNYFNQKVYIDKRGNIKNGLNNQESYGNINSITKEDFLKHIGSKKFQKLWNVKKEDTLVCKDCEFRFMCVDPRVPKLNSKGQWFHTEECNYNPYLSKWKGEEGYKTLTESGVDINESGELFIDKEMLKNIFDAAWS